MRFMFNDDTYTDLCDKLNELDFIHRVNKEVTNEDIIYYLVLSALTANLSDKQTKLYLMSNLNELDPRPNENAGDLADELLNCGIDALLRDLGMVSNFIDGRGFDNVSVLLRPVCYEIVLDVL